MWKKVANSVVIIMENYTTAKVAKRMIYRMLNSGIPNLILETQLLVCALCPIHCFIRNN
jgi:hypothetical protein